MRELNRILEAWKRDPEASGVLATVVQVEGSAYRRPGARMLIPTKGPPLGTISGGCLEGDVARKAAWWTAGGKPVVRVYDSMSDEDAIWEFGLGCRGIIHLLLERVESSETQALFRHLYETQRRRQETVVATVVRAGRSSSYRTGDHLLPENIPHEMETAVRQSLATRRSSLLHLGDADVFVEYIAPRQRLVVFGAGHDAVPVVAAASLLGWSVTVADVRSGYAKAERFPGVESVIVLPPSGDVASVEIDRDTAVVVMTHNLALDVRLLPQILRRRPCYAGLLGPRQRTETLLAAAGLDPHLADLYSPAGLDLGGDSPEAIAISIVAEIQAVLEERPGGFMRGRLQSIHEPTERLGSPSLVAEGSRELAVCGVEHA